MVIWRRRPGHYKHCCRTHWSGASLARLYIPCTALHMLILLRYGQLIGLYARLLLWTPTGCTQWDRPGKIHIVEKEIPFHNILSYHARQAIISEAFFKQAIFKGQARFWSIGISVPGSGLMDLYTQPQLPLPLNIASQFLGSFERRDREREGCELF